MCKFINLLNRLIIQFKLFFYNIFHKNKRLFLYDENNLITGVLKLVPYKDELNNFIGYEINISYFYFVDTSNRLYHYLNTFKYFKLFYSTSLNDNVNYEIFLQIRLLYFLKPKDKKFPKKKFRNDFDKLNIKNIMVNIFYRNNNINFNTIFLIINKIPDYIIREDENYNFIVNNSPYIHTIHFNKYFQLDSKIDKCGNVLPTYKKTYLAILSIIEDKRYYLNGELHKTDGPAWETNHVKKYYLFGQRHKKDGPAIEFKNISNLSKNEYYLYDKKIKKNNLKILKLKNFQKKLKNNIFFE